MKEKREHRNQNSIRKIFLLVFIVMTVTSINACGYLGIFGEASWKEEVLLHDGSKIVVKRWQKLKGSHEIGQKPPVGAQSIKFTLPGTNKTIKWYDDYSREIRRSNFELFALHILNSTPYIITSPRLCQSYNIWGRPNPPYVIFKYEGNAWKRIEIAELPQEFKNINLIINTEAHEKKLVNQGLVSAEMVKELNSSLTQPECKNIVRKPIEGIGCEHLVTNGRGTWVEMGLFTSQPTYETCLDECKNLRFDTKHCPCSRLFKTKTKEK
jgi:hypothetical protein